MQNSEHRSSVFELPNWPRERDNEAMNHHSGYGQYCPIAKAAEVFADRWTPLIMRELHFDGVHRFNGLERNLPGISRSLLSQRLRRLARAGVVERGIGPNGHAAYQLTAAGQELFAVTEALGQWGARWAFPEPQPDELDPILMMAWIRRSIHRDLLPPRRTVAQFDFRGARRHTAWLILESSDISVCLHNPGFEIDLLVSADLAGFYRYWFGWIEFEDAVADGLIQIDGLPALVRAFPKWLKRSHFVPTIQMTRTRLVGPRGAPTRIGART